MALVDLRSLARSAALRLPDSQAPEAEAFELIRYVFARSRADVLYDPSLEISDDKLAEFDRLVEKRASGYPLQYIIGEWDFSGHTFYLDENVLIPRTETEQIADEAIRFYKNLDKLDCVIIDMCTGSGCIGLSVAAAAENARVFLCDISDGALACAEKNRKKLGLDNVAIRKCDIFKGFDDSELPRPDIFLCNPPYVPREELPSIQPEVKYEPMLAVDGGAGGMDFYGILTKDWIYSLNPGGFFMFESGEGQPEQILNNIDSEVFDAKAETDICGIERFVSGKRKL